MLGLANQKKCPQHDHASSISARHHQQDASSSNASSHRKASIIDIDINIKYQTSSIKHQLSNIKNVKHQNIKHQASKHQASKHQNIKNIKLAPRTPSPDPATRDPHPLMLVLPLPPLPSHTHSLRHPIVPSRRVISFSLRAASRVFSQCLSLPSACVPRHALSACPQSTLHAAP
eukprot:1937031-Rhodomonas_salina.1